MQEITARDRSAMPLLSVLPPANSALLASLGRRVIFLRHRPDAVPAARFLRRRQERCAPLRAPTHVSLCFPRVHRVAHKHVRLGLAVVGCHNNRARRLSCVWQGQKQGGKEVASMAAFSATCRSPSTSAVATPCTACLDLHVLGALLYRPDAAPRVLLSVVCACR